MAKFRYINTKFWNDTYISELDPSEKLLFVYLLTNEHTNICGIYELPLKIIAIETGFDKSMLEKIFPRLVDKVRYFDGYVVIKNYIKHQNQENDKVVIGIEKALKTIPEPVLSKAKENGWFTSESDTPSIPLALLLNNSNSNSNSNLNNNMQDKPASDSLNKDTEEILSAYSKEIKEISRVTPLLREKVKTCLKTISKEDLLWVINWKAGETWFMENCAWRGAVWFFGNRNRLEKYLSEK